MKKICILLLSLLSAPFAFAQMSAPTAKFIDSTHYFGTDLGAAVKQDPIFVFFSPSGKLEARPKEGQKAVFYWSKLDTAALPAKVYTPLNTSGLVNVSTLGSDTLGYGCYRALVYTVRVDTIWRDTIDSMVNVRARYPNLDRPANTETIPPADTGYFYDVVKIDTLDIIDTIKITDTLNTTSGLMDTILRDTVFVQDTTFVVSTLRTALGKLVNDTVYPNDTLRAWIIVDSFSLCEVRINPFNDNNCDDPNLVGRFTTGDGNCSEDPNFHYLYYNLEDTGKIPVYIPNNYGAYLLPPGGGIGVKWTPSCNIHQDATGFDAGGNWSTTLNTNVPHPLWDATYKLEVENYFGNKATITSDTVRAYAVFAKLEIATTKQGAAGDKEWEVFAPEAKGQYDAPLYVKVRNNSVNAKLRSAAPDSKQDSEFEWDFYGNEYEDSSKNRMPAWQYFSSDPREEVNNEDAYMPGLYPIKMIVVNHNGCTDTAETTVEITEFLLSQDNFTSVFSPKSSTGENLYFKIKNPDEIHSVSRFEVNVMNRWGQLMFSSKDLRFEWDGKIKGTNSWASDGVYFYIVKAEGMNNHRKKIKQKLTGNVHLFGSN